MHKYFKLATIVILFLTACSSTKDVAKTKENKNIAVPEPELYMSSYTRLSDIIHTELDVSFDWDSCFVIGKAYLLVKPYFKSSDQLILDAKGFKINKIVVDETHVKYTYDGRKLIIQLPKVYTREETYNVHIDYVAMPNRLKVDGSAAITSDKGLYFINPQGKEKYKPKQIWTQGETEANSCWFPTIEATNERFSQEIYITVDTAMITLSNGALQYSMINGNGTRTDYWKQELTHAPYLVMLAVGNFEKIDDQWRDMEVSYYMEPEYAKYARLIFGKTPEMIEFFSNKLGVDYPWDKYSQIVVRDFVSGAMENTSAVVFFDRMNMNDREYLDNTYEDIISHELFHHWFGDLVTAESWPNLPLSESFATYGQYLWNEYKYGRSFADKEAQSDLFGYLLSAQQNQVDMIRFELSDREEMFDANSYNKGGLILHMLRKYVGDEVFFESLKLYLTRHQYQAAEIHQLRLAFEEVSGEDLNWFFNQWFLASGHPVLDISYNYNQQTKKAGVTIRQIQDFDKTPLYKLPLDIDIYWNDRVERKQITVTKAIQNFEWEFAETPLFINVDAEKMLVGVKKDNHTKDEWIAMYNSAPLYLDRYEAIAGLSKHMDDPFAQEVIIKALDDENWNIRQFAIGKCRQLGVANKQSIHPKLILMAKTDSKSSVRAKALVAITDYYPEKYDSVLYQNALLDSSYTVVSTALRTLIKNNKQAAIQFAKANENNLNYSLSSAIAELYALEGTSKEHKFFLNYFERATGYGVAVLIPQYKNYIKRMDDETIKAGVEPMKQVVEHSSTTWVESSAKGMLAEMLTNADTEELKAYIRAVMEELDKKL